jgi:MbtH protein
MTPMSTPTDDEDDRDYVVVVNHEEQYSIWLADRPLPNGWRTAGKSGKRAECLAHIGEVWKDMRPLSLRKAVEADAANEG